MNRSGYVDYLDVLDLGRWRGQVISALRGKRGQKFLRDLIAALDTLPEKKLIADEIIDESGCVCALGALAIHRGISPDSLDPYEYKALGKTFDIAHQLAQETMWQNDERDYWKDSPETRWIRMRAWAEGHLIPRRIPAATN